ncbi:MAG: DUF3300 domain-containing protein [Alphaproteobacteria bacterium]
MKQLLAVSLGITFEAFALLAGWGGTSRELLATAAAQAQEYPSSETFSPEQLDNLLAPIALYPDPLLAQVLLAATFVDQVDEAARWMRAHNDTSAIDDQSWDVSVKAVAHYPSVLYMMSDQIDWTTSVGQAYVYQSTDVMKSIQRLRALAHSAGNLVTNEWQQVEVDADYISIVPAQPRYIYVPTYDPYIVYFGPTAYFGLYPATVFFFGPPFPIGAWLNYDCDWHRHRIYYHGWHGRGWIARSRPIIHITNIYVNSRYANIQVNRNIIHRHVNYINLNRYSSVHRDVNYNNLIRDKRADIGKADAGNKIIRRNLDVTDPRLDAYHGRAPVPAAREKRPPPAQTKPQPVPPSPAPTRPPQIVRPAPQPQEPTAREKGLPPPQTRPQPVQPSPAPARPPQVVRPVPQQAPRDIQRPPQTVFGGSGSVVDPRAASQRGQESRSRVSQPSAGPTTAPARPPATRPMPSAPGRR